MGIRDDFRNEGNLRRPRHVDGYVPDGGLLEVRILLVILVPQLIILGFFWRRSKVVREAEKYDSGITRIDDNLV